MKFRLALLLWLAWCQLAPAHTNEADLGALLDSVQQWAQENLEEVFLRALPAVDHQQVENFLKNYQTWLQGDYVLDMAQLKESSKVILPLLDAHEETQPYAVWLRTRLDYFEAAAEMMALAPTRPKTETNAPPVNPSFKTEQKIWIKKVSPRPWPKGAAELVPRLKTIFAAERVPTELVWLAEVESGFDARARSPAGALGLYQLMPATAKGFGLSLWPRDQRRIPEVAARAAAQYLRKLHDQFGSWRLAVAAYNCGEGTVQRTLSRHQAKSYERIAPHLPAETQMYVPKVEATLLHREGIELEKLKLAPARER